jgi:pSer/pThr/pTyr-binding forkhead associated (FHA) protein
MEKGKQPGELDDLDEYSGQPVSQRVPVRGQRILCVDELERSATLFRAVEGEHDVVVVHSSVEALGALERAGDFAVLIVATEPARSVATARFLEAARAISPTTARVVLTDGANAKQASFDAAFRVVSVAASLSVLRDVLSLALDYHRLLATSPAQPVEALHIDHTAMLPPAKLPRRQAELPVWQGFIESARHLAARPVEIAEAPPFQHSAALRVGVFVEGRTVELLRGDTVVGRSRTCHIPIADARVSRRHARFSNDGYQVTVHNSSSTNALSVNGDPLEPGGTRVLTVGDRIGLGSREIEVCALGDYSPSLEPTEQVSLIRRSDDSKAASTLATLARVAEKYFALGQIKEAERLSKPLLDGLLRYCREGRAPVASDIELAVGLTLRIAESSHGGEWIDYLFELFSALGKPMTQEVVDSLYRLIPEAQGAKMVCFRRYADVLLARQERFGPGERFLVRRIQGLETALMMSAHV